MKKARFLNQRRPAWLAFRKLLSKTEKSRISSLSGREVSAFSRLFRAVCYDLATVRSRDWGSNLEGFLNDLVRRGHSCLYRSPPGRPRELIGFFSRSFPRLLRENLPYFWVALVLFLLPGTISGIAVCGNPSLAGRILPANQMVALEKMYSETREGKGGTGSEAAMAGFYVHNNVGIAFKCFATGILFGGGTIFFLLFNSLFLGTVTGFLIARGNADHFFSFVISHGSFELTAIVVSGAAGLILGHAIVHPGAYSRLDALRKRGLSAVKLAAGAGGMLGVAAIIEAFWSPSGAPGGWKYAVGTLLWFLVIAYFTLAGRETQKA